MKKQKRLNFSLLGVFMLCILAEFFLAHPMKVEAASSKTFGVWTAAEEPHVKEGKYYFWLSDNKNELLVSTSKKGKVYYAERINNKTTRIMRCGLNGKNKKTVVKKLSAAPYSIGKMTSSYVYYVKTDNNYNEKYYRYNIKTKKSAQVSQSKSLISKFQVSKFYNS